MKISRDWATPLTIGVFGLMSTTGILMFFHLDTGLNKLAHEWLGWLMVAGVVTHVVVNWNAFKRYFLSSNLARAIMGLSALVLAASFVSPPGGQRGMSPPVLAMKAVLRTPVASLAPLTGKPAEQMLKDLSSAGIDISDAGKSIESLIGDQRELQGKAMNALFRKN